MDIVDAILSTEVLAGVVMVAVLGMIVRCFLSFTREAASLAPKLAKIESDLTRLQEEMPDKKKRVSDLAAVVYPLRDREGKLRAYYDGLRNMELEQERAATQSEGEEQAEEQAEKKKRGQRRLMGLD